MREILLVISDTHGGHDLGLCNPETVLPADDEIGRPVDAAVQIGAFQELLWRFYVRDLEKARGFTDGAPVTLLHLGDVTHGQKHPEHLMSTRMADQILIALANFEPVFKLLNIQRVRLAKGTGSHAFGEGSSEILVAELLKQSNDNLDVRCLYHGWVEMGGIGVDYAHHGAGPGIRDWTRGNQVRYYVRDLVARQRRNTQKLPARLYLRGHYHAFVWETWHEEWRGKTYSYDIFSLPSYCGMGNYGHQVTRSVAFQDFGMLAIELVDGQIRRIRPLKRRIDIRTREVIGE